MNVPSLNTCRRHSSIKKVVTSPKQKKHLTKTEKERKEKKRIVA